MKTLRNITPLVALLLLASCAAVAPGHDPVIVNAERVIADARSTFTLLTKTELETYPAIKASNPTTAAAIRNFTNKVRANQATWLQSATDLKDAYAAEKSDTNKTNLDRALSILTTAIAEANKYITTMSTTSAWLSFQLSEQIGE